MKVEKSNQGLKYLKELELLRRNYDNRLFKLQSRKEVSADVATKRYVDLLRGKFGISRKEWKNGTRKWTPSLRRKIVPALPRILKRELRRA